MIKNYFEILNINNSSSKIDICKAYKTLSLKYHPDNINSTEINNFQIFSDINEAFEVLINPTLKSKYEEVGYQVFKNGSIDKNGNFVPGYSFLGNPEKIFEEFFGTNNYQTAIIQTTDEQEKFLLGRNKTLKKPPININLTKEISLLDILKGRKIKIEFEKNIIETDGLSTSIQKVIKYIDLLPGFDPESSLKFEGEGNQLPGFDNGFFKS